MSITLTPEQETIVQSKIQTGKYQSSQDVLDIALRLLEEHDRLEKEWTLEVREKIEAALLEKSEPIDGQFFINQILDRFEVARQNVL